MKLLHNRLEHSSALADSLLGQHLGTFLQQPQALQLLPQLPARDCQHTESAVSQPLSPSQAWCAALFCMAQTLACPSSVPLRHWHLTVLSAEALVDHTGLCLPASVRLATGAWCDPEGR